MFFNNESDDTQILSEVFSFPSTISNLKVYVDNEMKYNHNSCDNTKINNNNRISINEKSNVTILFDGYLYNTDNMFYSCSSIVSLDLSNFNTAKVII